ncbi:hypothetical protein FPZ43_12655 [Mucilaginibacter pallidiroseus]|uniref:Lipopolysaccharide assembly protein A domain-containing protein n=1 Tax=Mucilaginibacter pallidiroseus TaxID=2599295 RepID=A0A563UCN9_9SPHI|nr:hypothetical protein [Mucilaginibacter pallidiroseus]TWR29104.1 hypothetical protein FPZ43_12655 [Mucilaginibacter pallidiroseus]
MSVKNIFVLVVTVLLTIVLMQNTDEAKFTILFSDMFISKLTVMACVALVAFIIGVLVGRPKNKKYDIESYHDEVHAKDDPKTLSNEDRDYIS